MKALLKACSGTTFGDRRDLAIVTLFLDAGLRLSELCFLAVEDVDVTLRTVIVLGKGNRVRIVGVNIKAIQALDRYLRIRRGLEYADSEALWLGLRGPMTPSGIRQTLEIRGAQAKIKNL